MYELFNYKNLKITYHEYNKLNRIRHYIQLNKELMRTTLSHILRRWLQI